jgi:predicted aspartyl protease
MTAPRTAPPTRSPLVAAVLALLALAGCAGPSGPCGLTLRTTVPIALERNIPFVVATINARPVTMIIDTGAQTMLLTADAVHRFGLATDGRAPMTVRGTGGESRSFPAILRRFAIGSLALPDQHAAVLPFDLPTVGLLQPDGLIGADVLSRYEIDLDLPRHRITFLAGHACPTDPPPWAGAMMLPLDGERARHGRFIVPVTLNGRALRALIDTGSQGSVVSTAAARALGVRSGDLDGTPADTLRGAGPAATPAHRHGFDELDVGGEAIRRPTLLVADTPSNDYDMILGTDYLALRRMWLAYARGVVFIARPARLRLLSRR